MARSDTAARTIADFGEQWTHFRDNQGYYASTEMFVDVMQPLLSLGDVQGKRVLDVGSGTGRIVQMLLDAGAAHVTAIEPSDAFEVLCDNLRPFGERATCRRQRGEELSVDTPVDLAVSIGVLHHIPDPGPVVSRMAGTLRPGGKLLVWLYGREGNAAYLSWVLPLRRLTTRLPHATVSVLLSPPRSNWRFGPTAPPAGTCRCRSPATLPTCSASARPGSAA